MKMFVTTAAIVAALTTPAIAQSAGTDSSGEAQGSTMSSTSAQDGKGPNAMDTRTIGSGAMGSGAVSTGRSYTPGSPGAKPYELNERAGETSAGEAGATKR